MTEYGFAPPAIGSYRSNHSRAPSWGGASSHNLSSDQLNIVNPEYGRGRVHNAFGQTSSDYRRGRRQLPQLYDNHHGTRQISHHSGPYSNHFPSQQQASINGRYMDPNDIPPLEEHYEGIPSRHPSYQNGRTLSQPYNPAIPEAYSIGPTNTYTGPPIQVPTSADNYSRRRRRRSRSYSYDRDGSDGSYSSRSHSTDTFSSRNSNRYYDSGQQYATIHPSHHGPTVVQPSQNLPIVVPISGGKGGYVVVPPAGQTMRVIDPSRPYKHLSFIDRILSPSTWGFGRKKGTIIVN
ncbi:hypothetical protein JR316_0007659 [Psilocybe cubensis]|uniref:Uncharacterized protein n=2 Tax=Psilocybe cubensis TaxID=181762 RepID=A0A8H7XU96_PSICU|nr:hypothetical protein JR316_0007659 [Psilocybe cubensis]KAH9479080.1 hypothetical protein JR316_0007659 [Psilocybe cubensis]